MTYWIDKKFDNGTWLRFQSDMEHYNMYGPFVAIYASSELDAMDDAEIGKQVRFLLEKRRFVLAMNIAEMYGRGMCYDDLDEYDVGLLEEFANENETIRNVLEKFEASKPKIVLKPQRELGPGGDIYVIRSGEYCKIGRSGDAEKRMKQIAASIPYEAELVCVVRRLDYIKEEKRLHAKFADKRVNGEWFLLTDEDVEYIRHLNLLEPQDD